MDAPRPICALATLDQWARADHDDTTLDADGGGVMLARRDADPPTAGGTGGAPARGGIAFDHACRGYHASADAGRIDRALEPWREWRPLLGAPPAANLAPIDPRDERPLVAVRPASASDPAAFGPAAPVAPDLGEPVAIAVDEDDRLIVADAAARRLLLYDLGDRRLLERIGLPGAPLDLASHGASTWVLTEAGLTKFTGRRLGTRHALPDLTATGVANGRVVRLAIDPRTATLWILVNGTGKAAAAAPLRRDADGAFAVGSPVIRVPGGRDLEFDGRGGLVVARGPDAQLRRWVDGIEDAPLLIRGYDGSGLGRAPDGRIACWTSKGLRFPTTARVRYLRDGAVTTFRLDSGQLQTEWGRVFIDACIPPQTRVRILASASDDDEPELAGERRAAADAASHAVPFAAASPPMPPRALHPRLVGGDPLPLHRRAEGPETPWLGTDPGNATTTYEAPIVAPRGRFLWVTLLLDGDGRRTPRLRSLRAEHPGHDLVARLPRAFSRDPAQASFLRRYLALADGLLGDLDGRSSLRSAMLDPGGAPEGALPWLAGFLGLAVDDRWPVSRRRRLIAEAAWLMRYRGTVRGLERFLFLVLDREVKIIERWQLRGLGGALGGSTGPERSSVVGGGFRVGGAVGEPGAVPLTGSVADAFTAAAHRFTVIVPLELSAEERAMVDHVLELHRPAHTVVDVCTVGAGMRVGRGLHVGLMSTIGRSGGFERLQLGESTLGSGDLVGTAKAGTAPAASRLGQDTRVG